MQDAHEFFSSLLVQVKEDVAAEFEFDDDADPSTVLDLCPTTQNFWSVT